MASLSGDRSAHPDFQAFLTKMNLDDASIAALEAAEAGE